jgi:hypothetical protein
MADALKEKTARREFNLCPMCWMPLYTDRRQNEDALWGLVQMVFKGKPAFSVEKEGYKHERAVLVFGVSELHRTSAGNPLNNCEDCHFVHKSVYAESAKFYNLWRIQILAGRRKLMGVQIQLQRMLRSVAYTEDVAVFLRTQCITDGISSGVFEFVTLFDDIPQAIGAFDSNDVVNLFFDVFSACRDCNQKMTVNKFIYPLFKMLIPVVAAAVEPVGGRYEPYRRRRPQTAGPLARDPEDEETPAPKKPKEFDDEVGMHCILLCGMLGGNDTVGIDTTDNKLYLTINDRARSDSWQFRFCITWCLFQILFSVWENRSISQSFRHHLSYVYSGIQDFYLSLLFYVLHCANGYQPAGLAFETFHFFYSSHLPFFIMKQTGGTRRSLSELIMEEEVTTRTRIVTFDTYDKAMVRIDFNELKAGVLQFWTDSFKPLSDFLHGRDFREKDLYSNFFCNPAYATQLMERRETTDVKLDIQTFNSYFTTTPGYWFHFKQITMVKIEKDSKLFFNYKDVPFVKQVYANWYRYLCMCILRLGMRPAGGLASHFQLGEGPSMHLSAILRAKGVSRWRTRVFY